MEEVKKRYPYLTRDERRMPDDFPSITLGGPFGKFFPLQIVNCNGNYAKAFSEAEVFVTGFPDPGTNYYLLCIADAQLYMGITYELLYRPNKQAEERRTKALKILEHFFADKGHFRCLKKLGEADNLCENAVQEVLAVHLFGPLAMEKSQIRVDASRYKGNADTKCIFCSTKVPTNNTSFGNREVWHGCGDILLDHTVVKIENESDEEDTKEIDEDTQATLFYSLEEHRSSLEDADEPAVKKMKTEIVSAAGGDAGGSKDAAVANTTVIEVKLAKDGYMPHGPDRIPISGTDIKSDNKTLSQVLAQTIVNAFLQVKMNPCLKHYFIPSFLASDKHVTIHMYRPFDDTLLTQAGAMPIITKGELNSHTILCIWLALNMLNFPRAFPEQDDQSEFYPKSNFAHFVGPKVLEIYKKELQMPLRPLSKETITNFHDIDRAFKYISKQYEKMKKIASGSGH